MAGGPAADHEAAEAAMSMDTTSEDVIVVGPNSLHGNSARLGRLLRCNDELRGCVQLEDIPVANIVVVGEQSSGKTSLIERLSDVSLPRGDGIKVCFAVATRSFSACLLLTRHSLSLWPRLACLWSCG